MIDPASSGLPGFVTARAGASAPSPYERGVGAMLGQGAGGFQQGLLTAEEFVGLYGGGMPGIGSSGPGGGSGGLSGPAPSGTRGRPSTGAASLRSATCWATDAIRRRGQGGVL